MSKLIDIAAISIEKALAKGANAADCVIFDATELSISQRLKKPETIERSESCGIGLRVFIDSKDGYKQAIISSTDCSQAAINDMVEAAVNMAKIAPADPHSRLGDKDLLAQNIVDLQLYDPYEPSAEQLKDIASEAEEAALTVKGITNSDGAAANYSKSETALVTSSGFAKTYPTTCYSTSVSVIAGSGTQMETDYDYSVSRYLSDLKAASEIGKEAASRAIARLNPQKLKTCQLPLVFDPRVARSLLGSFIGAINGASVAKGTSFLKDKMGEMLFNQSINIIDNPLIKKGLGSEPFDSEGIIGSAKKIIENGRLTSWLLDTRSANQLGLKSTGNAERGLSAPPYPSATNFYMEAGKDSRNDIIGAISEGIYITETFGMGINGVTGDYSQGASGFYIKNGEITHPVSEFTIAGNLLDMFKNMTAADDLEFLYSTNAPTMRIEGMTIAGV